MPSCTPDLSWKFEESKLNTCHTELIEYSSSYVLTTLCNIIMSLSSNQHKDLLQLMIDATEGEDGGKGKLSDEEIVANSILFLLAGFETTANALSFVSYLLALHPEIQERLQAEIDEYFESKPVSWSLMHTTLA